MRSRSILLRMAAFLPAVLAVASILDVASSASARSPLLLITTEEAAVLRMNGDWPDLHRKRSASLGPRVVVERPRVSTTTNGELIETGTPTALLVRFEANGDPVDMRSLEVTARKGWLSKSLTERLRPYVKGTTLTVDEISIPEGDFLIEIEIADTDGTATTASYRVTVNAH